MVQAVDSHQVPLLVHTLYKLFISLNALANQKERRFHSPLLQTVQKNLRVFFAGPIVKG